ncbi:MAG: elongation factor P [Spirochaetes bacterium]|nr:elongation factor P [Spirochaetota bacterium]
MIEANNLKNGVIIRLENELFLVQGTQHVKPGKGPAYIKTKLKNFLKGNVLEKTFRSSEKVDDVYVDRRNMQFLYATGDEFTFMDNQTYDQITLSSKFLDSAKGYLKEGMNVDVLFLEEKPISVDIPIFVELEVVSTEPGLKGDTVSTPMKPAQVETGATVMVPLFINVGQKIKIDTRSNTYIERA